MTTDADTHGVAGKFVGPLLVGTLFNVCLFGVCLMQAHTYSLHCEHDARWIKWMVTWTVFMEAVSSSLASFISYDYAVRDFGEPDKVLIRTPEFSAFILTIGICSTTVQCFYGWRVKRLLGRKWLAYVIYTSAVAQMLCVTGVAAGDSIVTSFQAFQQFKPVRAVVIVWMVLAPVTDLFIAGLLVFFLRKSRTGFRKTDSMLNKLTILTVQTGAITALDAILGLLLFLSVPDFIHLLFIFTLPSFYGVCLMSSLNARSAWSASLEGEQTYLGKWTEASTAGVGQDGVHITTTIVTESDRTAVALELAARADSNVSSKKTRASFTSDFKRPSTEYARGSDVKKIAIGDGLSLRSLDLDLEVDGDSDSIRRVDSNVESEPETCDIHESRVRSPQPTHPFPDRRKELGWRDML